MTNSTSTDGTFESAWDNIVVAKQKDSTQLLQQINK